jgi:uncharacterized RDD family membrane protein YckC
MADPRPSPLNRMIGAIVPRAVDALDPDELLDRLDLDAVLARVDLNALLDRLDLDAVLARLDLDALMARIDIDALVGRVDIDALVADVDIDALVGRVDIDALVGRVDVDALVADVDVDALVARVDVDRLMQRVDVDALMARVDVNGLIDQVDLPAVVARAGIDQIVADATTGIAARTLDLGRSKLLGIDLVVLGLVDRVLRRPPAPSGPPWSAGPLARILAYVVDSISVSALFGLGASLGGYLFGLFTNRTFETGDGPGAVWIALFIAWWFAYLWLSVAVAGRTLGKGLVGLRVVAVDGTPLSAAGAARRALVFPLSFVLGLGFVPAIVRTDRRALHDLAAGSREVVDWGPREVTPPPRATRWAHSAPAS